MKSHSHSATGPSASLPTRLRLIGKAKKKRENWKGGLTGANEMVRLLHISTRDLDLDVGYFPMHHRRQPSRRSWGYGPFAPGSRAGTEGRRTLSLPACVERLEG